MSSHYIIYYLNIIDHYLRYEEYDLAMELCQKALLYVEKIDQNNTKNKLDSNSDIQYRVSSEQKYIVIDDNLFQQFEIRFC